MGASSTGGSNSLKEYLKRYESGNGVEERKKKKKKGKKPDANPAVGVVVVDEDPVWQKAVNLYEESDESADEEKPQVDEDIEVRRMKRLEQLRLSRPYNAIAEDGSGWVSLDPVRDSSKQIADMSPPRKLSARDNMPSPEPELKPPASGRDDDLSPPRQRRNRRDTPSPKFGSERVDSDLSPPRKRRARNDSPSPEPENKPKSVDADLSSPRQQRKHHYTPSPERDISSSRRGQRSFSIQDDMSAASGLDLSPPRKRRNDVGGPGLMDLSPPRKRRTRNDSPSPECEMKPTRVDTDLSPPRQQRKHHHTPSPQRDNSVSRRASHTSSYRGDDMRGSNLDLSPPRKKRNDSGGPGLADLSPSRSHRRPTENDMTRASLDPDLSPPRKSRKEDLFSAPLKAPQRTGLISAVDIRNELSKAKAENTPRFQEMDPTLTGQGAAGVYRDKIKGVRISKDEYLKSKQKKEEKPKEIKLEWGKGLAQKREAEARLQELELEKDKPFARTRDDPELDKMLKDRLRWGDPMAHLVKKKHYEPVLPDLGDNEKMKESGFIIPQDIPSHSWIKRGLDAAPNRYGIRPGRHWDGVDRSNGYEQQMFTRMNEKRATEREAYLWSVSDM